MPIVKRWPWVVLVGCVVGGALVLAALAQEGEPAVEDVGEAEDALAHEPFVMLGKLGDGLYHEYADIPFRMADYPVHTQLLMVGQLSGLEIPRDEFPLGGQVTRAVHLMALTAFSLETPHGTPAGIVSAVYEDGGREVLQLFEGVDVAEWSYENPLYGFRLAHERVPPAFIWAHDDPEAGEHPGYAFYTMIETEARPLDRLELELNVEAIEETPGGNFALMVSAVTLELAPPEAEDEEADR
jgi:hypothetical protein